MGKTYMYHLNGKRSIPTNQIVAAEHHSRMPLGMDMREWLKYYSVGKRPILIGQMVAAGHRSRVLLRNGMKE